MIDIEIQIPISERSSGWAINYLLPGNKYIHPPPFHYFRNMQWLSTRSFVWRKSLTWLPNLLVVIEQPINAGRLWLTGNRIYPIIRKVLFAFFLWRSYCSRIGSMLRLWRTMRQNVKIKLWQRTSYLSVLSSQAKLLAEFISTQKSTWIATMCAPTIFYVFFSLIFNSLLQ